MPNILSRPRSKSPVPEEKENGLPKTVKAATTEKESTPTIHHKYRMSQKLKEGVGLSHKTKDETLIYVQQRHNDHAEKVNKLAHALSDLDSCTRAQLHREDMVIAQLEVLAADSPLEKMVAQISIDHKARKEETLATLDARGKLLTDLSQQWKENLKKTNSSLKKEQEAARMDFDHYSVKVESLRKKITDDTPLPPKLESNEEKLKASRIIYHDTTDAAVRVYDTIFLDRWNDLAPILDTYLDQNIALTTVQAEYKKKLIKSKAEQIPELTSFSARIPLAKGAVEKKNDNASTTKPIACPTSTQKKTTSSPPLPTPKLPTPPTATNKEEAAPPSPGIASEKAKEEEQEQ